MHKVATSLRRNGENDALLRDTDCAALVGVSRATWWRWVSAGTIPAPIRIGGVTRWWRSDIEALLADITDARDTACA